MKATHYPSTLQTGRRRVTRRTGLLLLLTLAAAVALGGTGCSRSNQKAPSGASVQLTVSAAASLADVLKAALPKYEQAHPGVHISLNMGSSGALANQIVQGAPVDIFISAGAEPMDRLTQQGLVDPAAARPFVENRLVLIVPVQSKAVQHWADLTSQAVQHIALANPAHVPAGAYGKATLQSLGLWEKVQARLVLGEDVRQTLQFVEAGEADAGLVYKTDAATTQKVVVVDEAPPGSHPPIVYPAAVLKSSAHPQDATALMAYLLGPDVAAQLRTAGFEVNR